MRQLIGEDEVAREDGANEGIKEGWLKDLETWVIPASTVDRWVTMPETVHRDKGKTLNQILSISTTMNKQNLQGTKYLTSDHR